MKIFKISLILICCFGLLTTSDAQCISGAVPIPDNNDGATDFTDGECFTLSFDPNGPAGCPTGVTMAIGHSWQGDLAAWVNGCGEILPLFARPGGTICAGGCCGSSADPNIANALDFKDGGALDPEAGITAAGTYGPSADCPGGTVTSFAALCAGCPPCGIVEWEVCISDGAGGDTGMANNINLLFGATCDVGLCGCTDPCASNYDMTATVDDGTCAFPAPAPEMPMVDICSGETPTLPTLANIPVPAAGGNAYTVSWYTVDADPSDCSIPGNPADQTNLYTPAALTNLTCAPTTLTVYAYAQCQGNDTRGATCGDPADCVDDYIYIRLGELLITIYPDATAWTVTEVPGDCATAASVSITAEDGTECFSDTGAVPPAGVCPSTNGEAPLTYTYDPAFPAACNMVFTNTVAAICPPVGCVDCPDIAPAIAVQEVCSGSDPDFATVETEVNATGNNIGAFSYFLDAAHTVPYAIPVNEGCASVTVEIFGRLMCADAAAAGTADEFDDFSFMVTVYPAQPSALVTINVGDACSATTGVISVDLIAVDGTVCDTKTFDASPNQTCAVIGESIAYTWTAAEIEGITGAPAALGCYADVSDTEVVNVYPEQPTVIINNVGDACSGQIGALVVDFLVGGSVCALAPFDADANLTCSSAVQNIAGTFEAANFDALFGAPPALGCYQDISIDENVNVYPDANNWTVTEVPGDCSMGASVIITSEDGTECFSQTGFIPGFECPDVVGDESITYTYDPGFPDACNVVFTATVAALCDDGCCADNGAPTLKKVGE